MATAQVTLKLSPHELQIVREALRLYRYTSAGFVDGTGQTEPFKHAFEIVNGDALCAVRIANELLRDIGLK